MGPWSEERQLERAENIHRILSNPDLSPEARRIWENHLANLATSESQYNARVVKIWRDMRNRYTEKWI
jgi:hypothetical protein